MKKKETERKRTLQESLDSVIAGLGKHVDTRWCVREYRPSHTDNDDVYWPQQTISASPWFKTEEEAQAFMDEHEPSQSYYKMQICREKQYERLTRTWYAG